MTNRERLLAVLHYKDCDRLPVVHFGYWNETLQKWAAEEHITQDEAHNWGDGNEADLSIARKLGFDFGWGGCFAPCIGLFPGFERKILEEFPDGSRKVIDENGAIIIEKQGVVSIPFEVDHLLKERESWEKHFKPRLQFSKQRINRALLKQLKTQNETREEPLAVWAGSLYGFIRNWLGLEASAYLYIDDERLFDEMIQTVADLSYECTKEALASGVQFDYGFFWEDICCKNGPLVNPRVFDEKVGPHYKRITDLLKKRGIDIVSLDCDGLIDALIPTWLENGVNTMFPIEVGTWNASIKPWRGKYGKHIRGVGGVRKAVFAEDYAAVDAEIERLKPLVELGGYIPCPDHRIPIEAKWENVQYYCEKMRETFSFS